MQQTAFIEWSWLVTFLRQLCLAHPALHSASHGCILGIVALHQAQRQLPIRMDAARSRQLCQSIQQPVMAVHMLLHWARHSPSLQLHCMTC
jgi:hypothetical protein